MGLSKSELGQQIDSIIEFSGLNEMIDMPVKNYSSGMRSRLGFAIVAHTNADILIMDEVLAVGDLNFRAKCFNYIESIKSNAAIASINIE